MAVYRLADQVPSIHESAYVVDNATVIGRAYIDAGASVWMGAIIRADNDSIRIGKGSNVQDGAVLHVDEGSPLIVGEGVTIGHQATLHGCTVGDGSLIGIRSVILNGAEIGPESLVGAGSLVTEGKRFPARSLIMGSPAKVVRTLSEEEITKLRWSSKHYIDRAQLYKAGLVLFA